MFQRVGIVGATGAVGETLLEILKSRKFPIDNLIPLASAKSAGTRVKFGSETIVARNLADFPFIRRCSESDRTAVEKACHQAISQVESWRDLILHAHRIGTRAAGARARQRECGVDGDRRARLAAGRRLRAAPAAGRGAARRIR